VWSIDGGNDRDGIRAPSPRSLGSDDLTGAQGGARSRGLPSGPDLELGQGERQDRRDLRLPAIHLAVLRCVPAQQGGGSADCRDCCQAIPTPVGPECYNRQAQALLGFDVLDRLAAVKAPTLCMLGQQDLFTSVDECREVADKIPGAKFELIKVTARPTSCRSSVRTISTASSRTSCPERKNHHASSTLPSMAREIGQLRAAPNRTHHTRARARS
jgi:pimeloyl-ACP methyl ester carboxylesterase